jgi:hypothetical protein
MSWNGDDRNWNFKISSTSKEWIELFAQVVRRYFDKALPPKRLNITTVNSDTNFPYFEMEFSFGYSFDELFRGEFNSVLPEKLMVINQLKPYYTVQILMVIERSQFNQYSYQYKTDTFYVVAPAVSSNEQN